MILRKKITIIILLSIMGLEFMSNIDLTKCNMYGTNPFNPEPDFYFDNPIGFNNYLNTTEENYTITWWWWDSSVFNPSDYVNIYPYNYQIITYNITIITNFDSQGIQALSIDGSGSSISMENLSRNFTIVFRDYVKTNVTTSIGVYFRLYTFNAGNGHDAITYRLYKFIWTPKESLHQTTLIIIPDYVYYLIVIFTIITIISSVYYYTRSCDNENNLEKDFCKNKNLKTSNEMKKIQQSQQKEESGNKLFGD